ncbi:MAG: cation:proton antiporter [Planctomycetes bacterium]|nr:cation:proton antiporter [Planctomycetota bacterium]
MLVSDIIENLFTRISITHLNILLLLGLALFGGTIGGRIFQRIKIPQVVGYIVVGMIVGQTGLCIVDADVTEILRPFSYFALGLIGFMIGGELKLTTLRKHGKQFLFILFAEGTTAFLFVAVLTVVVGSFTSGDARMNWALGLLLGAIASATAPAATTDVLWEYRTRGPLTTTVLGIVALDDGLALALFAIASAIAGSLMSRVEGRFLTVVWEPVYEIFGSVFIGVLFGLMLSWIIKRTTARDRTLAFAIGLVLLVLGVAQVTKVDMLLAAMAMGATIVNVRPRKSREFFTLVGSFTPPIYVLFFVLFGAKLNLGHMSSLTITLAIVYLVGRTSGKMLGANFGARLAGAPRTVQKYLPMCLFSQAGVAIGLSILAGQRFSENVGDTILVVITATTFVVQLLGPPATKWAVTKAGEVGLNVTDEDIVRDSRVADAMNPEVSSLHEGMHLRQVMQIYGANAAINFPVVDANGHLAGVITVESIKNSLTATELDNLLLAHDLMEPVVGTTAPDMPLCDACDQMNEFAVDYLPVVTDNQQLVGMLEAQAVQRFISKQRLAIEQKLASMG